MKHYSCYLLTQCIFLAFLLVAIVISSRSSADPVNFIPQFKGTLFQNIKEPIKWEEECFKKNEARILSFSEKSVEIQIKSENKSSLFCSDLYLIATPHSFHVKDVLMGSDHVIRFNWKNEKEYEDAKILGIFIFSITDKIIGTLVDLYEAFKLFTGPAQTNIEFLETHMNMTFEKRSIPFIDIPETDLDSGDHIAVLNPRKGEVVVMFGTGGVTDHSAIILKMDGELYVTESTGISYLHGQKGIIKTPWKKWIQDYTSEEGALLTLMKPSPERRAMFNVSKAIDFFKRVEGTPYGDHSFIYTWIDTVNGNYPPPLSQAAITIAFALLDKISPNDFMKYVGEGLNKRLGTEGLGIEEIFKECSKRNITFGELLAKPELDEWVYSDGYSMVCSSYVARVYKESGMLDDVAIQGAEFTPRDMYQLDVWDNQKLESCKHDENEYPYCQIYGIYKLPLPGAGSVKPYDHMFEKCGALPPTYERFPPQC